MRSEERIERPSSLPSGDKQGFSAPGFSVDEDIPRSTSIGRIGRFLGVADVHDLGGRGFSGHRILLHSFRCIEDTLEQNHASTGRSMLFNRWKSILLADD